MNQVIEQIRDHKTIREFTDKKVEKDQLDLILDSLMRTASSTGLQRSSIIRVTDQAKKDAIANICKQDYVARAPELLIFVADLYRNQEIVKEKRGEVEFDSHVDKFFQAFTDSCLLAQNANNIVESLGMGAVFLGSILNDAREIIKILDLPKLTFPVLGLGFGYPNQEPQIKPRMKKELRVFENSYKILDSYSEAFKEYDEEMTEYYDLRDSNNRVDSFTDQVLEKETKSIPTRLELIEIAKENGIKL